MGWRTSLQWVARASSGLAVAALLVSCGGEEDTGPDCQDDGLSPTELGRYAIGHTAFLVEDPNRLINDQEPEKGNWPVYMRVWYPAEPDASGTPVEYNGNNPVYGDFTSLATPSPHGALADVSVAVPDGCAVGGFPMVVFSHGRTLDGNNDLETHELLASHGFVVVAPDHTRDMLWAYFSEDPDLGLLMAGCMECRALDIGLVIDEMLARNANADDTFFERIDPDRIGLEGFSRGVPSIVGAAVGLEDEEIPPEDRVKALLLLDGGAGTADLFSEDELSTIDVPVLVFKGEVGSRLTAEKVLDNASSEERFGLHLPFAEHIALGKDTCASTGRVLDAMAAGTANNYDVLETYIYVDNSTLHLGVFDHCPSSVLEGRDPAHLADLHFPDPPLAWMPRTMPRSELQRIKGLYTVAFFDTHLAGKARYSAFLEETYAEDEPLLHFAVGEFPTPVFVDHPLDLQAGDAITFEPVGVDSFSVQHTTGGALETDVGANLGLDDDGTAPVSFAAGFPYLGATWNQVQVNANGNITLGDQGDSSSSGTAERFTAGGRLRIAPYFSDLNPEAAGSIRAKDLGDRLVVTWDGVPHFDAPDDGLDPGPNTAQVILSATGKIEFVYGDLDADSHAWGVTATIGIGTGHRDEVVTEVDHTALAEPMTCEVGSVFETFTVASGE
jgi:hypothetical protein